MAVNQIKDFSLTPTKAPNLPISPVEYSQNYHDQFSNALRQYFAQVDNDWGALLGRVGGKYLEFPHISASDTTDQYADGNDDPTQILWNTLESGLGFTLNLDGTATAEQSGVYKIDYSLQLANTANTAHDVIVWLEVTNGGTNQVPRSATKFTIPARKSAGVPTYLVAYSSITFEMHAGDKLALWWATDLAYDPVGPVNGVYMEYIPAQVSPYAHPESPSAVGSITFVSTVST